MIALHRLNQQEFVLNADLIETIEATPDTLITLTTGKKLMVRDAIADVIGRVIGYRQLCHGSIQVVHADKREPRDDESLSGVAVQEGGKPASGVAGRNRT